MKFRDNVVSFLQKHMSSDKITFGLPRYNFRFCSYETWNEPQTLEYIIRDYQQFYQKAFSGNKEYPLFNTYIIPCGTYEKVMAWVTQLYEKLYPWAIEPPNAGHFGHIGGIYERIMAYAVGEEDLPYVELNVEHDTNFKMLNNYLGE